MEKVTSEDEEKIREVWEEVLVWNCCVPESYLNEVESKYSTTREKTSDIADVYVNSYPEPSWERLVNGLYCCGEMAAAKEAKSFLQKNGEELCIQIVLIVSHGIKSKLCNLSGLTLIIDVKLSVIRSIVLSALRPQACSGESPPL